MINQTKASIFVCGRKIKIKSKALCSKEHMIFVFKGMLEYHLFLSQSDIKSVFARKQESSARSVSQIQ